MGGERFQFCPEYGDTIKEPELLNWARVGNIPCHRIPEALTWITGTKDSRVMKPFLPSEAFSLLSSLLLLFPHPHGYLVVPRPFILSFPTSIMDFLAMLWNLSSCHMWTGFLINHHFSLMMTVCHYKIFHTWWPLSITYSKIHESLAWGMSNDPCINTPKSPSYKGSGRQKTHFQPSVFNLRFTGSAWQLSFAK